LETGKKIFLVISAPFLIFSIMSYQSLVLFYAAGAIMLLITFATWRKNDMKNSHLRAFAAIVITGLAALIGYYLISKGYLSYKHIEASSYLTGQVPWGHKPFGEVAYTTYISIKMVVLGESNFYNKSFLFAFIGIAIYLLYRWIIQKKNSSKEAMYFMMLFTIPFLLTILLGGIEVARARMPALQLVVGFSVYFLYQHVKNKVLAFGVLFIALALCVSQGVVTSNLLYSEQIKYQNDVSTAGRIVSQLDGELSRPFSDYTFTLAGNNYHPTLPNFDPAGEMLGRSFFEFDQQSPAMWATSYRAANFMQTQGYDFKAPDVKQMGAVKSLSQERGMTVWPQKGSIYIDEQDNLIIVKMSEYKSN